MAGPSPGLGTPTATPAPGAPPKPPAAAAAAGTYTVQVGAFAVKANAEKMQKRLEEKGHAVTIRQGSSSKVPGHRVLVGEYADRADAQAQRDKVLAAGGKGAKVVSMGAGKFTVEAGTFKSLDAAIDLSRELQQSGLVSRIDSRPTAGAGLYQVQVGNYATKEDAESQVATLRKEGLNAIVLKN
jgi:cell division protein FtsN